MGRLILGYWNIRGLVEPARLLLEYGEVDYEETKYERGDAPDYDASSWFDVKFKLGLDFPNLPYLIDGDVKMTESWAIYKYIARKIGLVPSNEKERYECEMLEGVLQSFLMHLGKTCYDPDFENLKKEMRETQMVTLQRFEDFIVGRKHLLGDKITYVDFAFFSILDYHRLLFPDILDKFPNLQGFMKKFESMERIAAYLKSDRFQKFPITSKIAKWGGQKQ